MWTCMCISKSIEGVQDTSHDNDVNDKLPLNRLLRRNVKYQFHLC
jgi:hypothetical protein